MILSNLLAKLTWILDNDSLILDFRQKYDIKVNNIKNQKIYIKSDSYLDFKKICWKEGLISHDDILFLSYKILLKVPRILDIIRAKFPYILIDEFQDTSPLQSRIIKLIAEKETIIGVIGDNCQSIFGFQGADVSQFINFNLDKSRKYFIKNNHRSTVEIVNLLNFIRGSCNLRQVSYKGVSNIKPTILVGNFNKNLERALEFCSVKDICILSYKNEIVNLFQYKLDCLPEKNISDNLFFNDSDRGKLIFFIISSIESARQNNFKNALKNMKKAYQKKFFSDKEAFKNLKRLIDNYEYFKDKNIMDFYNEFLYDNYEVKNKISSGAIKKYYEKLNYKEVAGAINSNDVGQNFKSIHKSKGEEFENVFVQITPYDFDENKDLEFLLNPNINIEEHRVFYVALSRAKSKLFISVPTLTKNLKERLQNIDLIQVIE